MKGFKQNQLFAPVYEITPVQTAGTLELLTKWLLVLFMNVSGICALSVFSHSIYYRTSDNTFIPISNSEKPVAGNKCYVQTKDIIIHPLTEYLSNDINQCGATSCHTCNIFVNNQSFKSNLTGKEYKTISYDRLSCGSTNVIYGIHCVHCGLVYVGETGRSLRSRMNGHRSAIRKGGQSLLHRHFHQPDHSVDDMRVQILEKVTTVLKIQPC